jgi:hypothetical protein
VCMSVRVIVTVYVSENVSVRVRVRECVRV